MRQLLKHAIHLTLELKETKNTFILALTKGLPEKLIVILGEYTYPKSNEVRIDTPKKDAIISIIRKTYNEAGLTDKEKAIREDLRGYYESMYV